MTTGQPPTFRSPSKLTDLAEFATEYITYMRAVPDNSACDVLVAYAHDYFRDVKVSDRMVRALAAMTIDRMYRHTMSLVTVSGDDSMYYARVFRYLLDAVAFRGVRLVYVLDNELRFDRFHLAMKMFMHAGVSVVTPYTASEGPMPLDAVLKQMDIELAVGRHVAYIEKDATVNYLEPVKQRCSETDYFCIFRNRAPDDATVEHIASRGFPAGTT